MQDISSERLAAVADQIEPQTHFAPLARTDAILICVPTPDPESRAGPRAAAGGLASSRGDPPAGPAHRARVHDLPRHYPGTGAAAARVHGLVVGQDINLGFSPERVDLGRTDYTLRTTPKIVGGVTAACTDRVVALYETVGDHVTRVTTPETGEMAKLLENIFRSVNIALVNELATLSDRMGVDLW